MQNRAKKKIFRSRYIILFAIVLAGYFFRLLASTNATISRDGIWYIGFSEGWLTEDVLSKLHVNDTVIFVYILKQILRFETNPVIAGLSLNIVLGSLFIVLTFLLLDHLTRNTVAALLCALIVAVHPTFIQFSSDILRENLFLCFSTLALFYVVSDKHRPDFLYKVIIAALFTSCAILTRGEGILLLFPCGLCILLRHKIPFSLIHLSVYLSFACSFYLLIIHQLAPEHKVNIIERTINFIF